MFCRLLCKLFLLGLTTLPAISTRAANVLQIYNTVGIPASPPPGTYTGNSYQFAGQQTFSDANGWIFDVSCPFPSEIAYRINRPDYTQQGYYGQYGTLSHPFVAGVPTPALTVGDYAGDHTFPIISVDGLVEDLTQLQILAVSYDPVTGAPTSLAADFFEAQPNTPGRVLFGQLRYNSDVSLGAGHPYVFFEQTAYAASESDDGAVITVQRQGGTDSAISASYTVSGGTATADVDYAPVSGTLTWAAGDAAPKTIYLPILKNSLIEGARTVSLTLTSDSAVPVPQTTVTIAQDPLPASLLHFRYYGFGAGDATQTSEQGFTFIVPTSSPPSTDVIVESTPGDGPLQEENLEFFGRNQLVVGSYTADKEGGFEFNGPYALENVGSENWQVLAVNYGVDGTLLQLAANFEILDTDGNPLLRGEIRYHSMLPLRGTVELSSPSFEGNKSAAQVQLTAIRQGDTSEEASVKYATTSYSALDGTDYTAVKGKLTWAAGEDGPKTFTVPLLHNPASGNRVFIVTLTGGSIGDNTSAAVTIIDDSQPSVALLPEPGGQVDAKYPLLISNSSEVYVGVIHPLADGEALIGGNFAAVGDRTQPGILRLDATGAPDFSFISPLGLAIEPEVKAITVQPDGKVLVAGHFTLAGSTKTVNLVRLNTDGSVDASFQESAGVSGGMISGLVLQPDGRILIGGDFNVGGGLARLNADGSLDASFSAPAPDYSNSQQLVLLQPDGKVLAIDDYGTLKRYNADGSVDNAYTAYGGPFGSGPNSTVLLPDGRLILIEDFSGSLVRLNRDGTIDTSFNLPTGTSSLNFSIGSLALQPDGKLLVGGSLSLGTGSHFPVALVRLNPDGTLDDSFSASTDLPASIGVMAPEPDGGLLLSAGYLSTHGQNIVHTVFAKLAGTSQGPTVTLAASGAEAGGDTGQIGEFLITIPAAQSTDMMVAYKVKGSGINGTDYAYLKGQAKIKAGKTSKTIKIVPQGDLGGASKKTVKLVLAPGVGYAVGAASKAKVTINGPTR